MEVREDGSVRQVFLLSFRGCSVEAAGTRTEKRDVSMVARRGAALHRRRMVVKARNASNNGIVLQGCRKRRAGGQWPCQILTYHLNLSQSGGRLCPPHYYSSPRIVRPSYGPLLLASWHHAQATAEPFFPSKLSSESLEICPH